MKILWITPLLLIQSYRTIGSHLQDDYNQYSFYQQRPLSPRPLDAMADLTNDLGVCVLRVIAAGGAIGNIAFSPFGLMAVSVLLYEGSSGYSALQIKQSLNLPWEILAVRVGVRDLNRYLKTYFKSDGFLNGLTMSREEVCLRPQFKRVLRLYGFDNPNSFLADSCPDVVTTTVQPMSVTMHGTVVTEMTPSSQTIQVNANITDAPAGDATVASATEASVSAKVTYMGDASFTISNVDANTNVPMNSQSDAMIVDIGTRPYVRPIGPSTDRAGTTFPVGDEEPKSSEEIAITDTRPTEWLTTESLVFGSSSIATRIATGTTPIAADDLITTGMVTMTLHTDPPRIDKVNADAGEPFTVTAETAVVKGLSPNLSSSAVSQDSSGAQTAIVDILTITTDPVATTIHQPNDLGLPATTVNSGDVTTPTTNGSFGADTTTDDHSNAPIGTVPSAKLIFEGDATDTTTVFQTAAIETTGQTTFTTAAAYRAAGDSSTIVVGEPTTTESDGSPMTTVGERVTLDRREASSPSTDPNSTENEIIKEAESNQHYQVSSLEKKRARSMLSADGLPTFNVEFVVRKEDVQYNCNQTRKRTIIKPDRILTEYPKDSGVLIRLRELSNKRKKRHLGQYQINNGNRNQWHNGYNFYRPPPSWIDRSSVNTVEPVDLFNAGYQRIPFFTYTAVLPFGFVYQLKSQVIEIPLDDPKYTLMILMPNHQDGLAELLLLLPTMSLRNIHNSLRPTAVHATIPMFKYTAKVDLSSALQQIGIQDVFYRYRADLSFMSPDARLFVSSVQQVVSVTAKKYNTPPVYEIQRKYVEHDFVVSRPFVYFVIDTHTKVSLIAGVITDPLAAPIWN